MINWGSPVFLVSGLVGLVFLLTYFFSKAWPPKEINDLYGYRSKRSKRNKEAWDFAQEYANRLMIKVSALNLLLGFIGLFLSTHRLSGVFLSLGFMIFTLIIKFVTTERALKRKFGE